MRMGVGLAITITICSNAALAFDNIEADVYYEREAKAIIEKQYAGFRSALEKQAADLQTKVRKKDLDALRANMYERAFIIGKCFDNATTYKKQINSRADIPGVHQRCIDAHLMLMDKLEKLRAANRVMGGVLGVGSKEIDKCYLISLDRHAAEPYDFLWDKSSRPWGEADYPLNFIRVKQCLELAKRSEQLLRNETRQ